MCIVGKGVAGKFGDKREDSRDIPIVRIDHKEKKKGALHASI